MKAQSMAGRQGAGASRDAVPRIPVCEPFGGQQQPTKQTGREKQPANQTSADALKCKVLKSGSFSLSACWSPVAHAGVPKKAPLPGESIH